MKRSFFIVVIGILLQTCLINSVGAYPWTINYVPTTDTYAPLNLNVNAWFGGYTDYDWTDPLTGSRYKESFEDSSFQYFSANFGLPTLNIGKWKIDSDIGLSHCEPDSPFYDETFFDVTQVHGKIVF